MCIDLSLKESLKETISDLKEGFINGQISVDEFHEAMIELHEYIEMEKE